MARGTKLQKHNERNSRQYVRSLYAAEARIAELETFVESVRRAQQLFVDGCYSEGVAQINASLLHLQSQT